MVHVRSSPSYKTDKISTTKNQLFCPVNIDIIMYTLQLVAYRVDRSLLEMAIDLFNRGCGLKAKGKYSIIQFSLIQYNKENVLLLQFNG